MAVTRRPAAFSRTPRELMLIPLPRPLTTPPVTTRYFILRPEVAIPPECRRNRRLADADSPCSALRKFRNRGVAANVRVDLCSQPRAPLFAQKDPGLNCRTELANCHLRGPPGPAARGHARGGPHRQWSLLQLQPPRIATRAARRADAARSAPSERDRRVVILGKLRVATPWIGRPSSSRRCRF